MNKQINLALLLLLSSGSLHAAIGCMDTSYHTHPEKYFQGLARSMGTRRNVRYDVNAKKYDYKKPHHVWCTCPCQQYRKMTSNRGICMKCKHFGDIARSYPIQGDALLDEERKSSFALFEQKQTLKQAHSQQDDLQAASLEQTH